MSRFGLAGAVEAASRQVWAKEPRRPATLCRRRANRTELTLAQWRGTGAQMSEKTAHTRGV